MRRLLLLRHAKSGRPDGVPDLDRPLDARGRAAAPRMGAYLAAEGLRLDFALVSPSLRTRETWEALGFGDVPLRLVHAIYEAPVRALLDAIRDAPAEAERLILVGHNPGIEDLCARLVADGPRAARDRLAAGFPTAALAVVDCDVERWDALGWDKGRLERFVRPKDLVAELTD